MAQTKELQVVYGHAGFVQLHTVEVDGRPLNAEAIVIATGSAERLLDLPRLKEEVGFLTAETLMEASSLPESLAVLGGGGHRPGGWPSTPSAWA